MIMKKIQWDFPRPRGHVRTF